MSTGIIQLINYRLVLPPVIILLSFGFFVFFNSDFSLSRQKDDDGIPLHAGDGVAWGEVTPIEMDESLSRELNVSRSDNWIVVTTVSLPGEVIVQLATMNGWQMVVIGDTKTPKNWSYPGVYFLGVEDQKRLGYRIHDLLPYKSYARKNIGYLFAIQHGAKTIYETDDDNKLIVGNLAEKFDLDLSGPSKKQLLMFEPRKDRNVVNPYIHFGQPSMWPRGFPLDSIAVNKPEQNYYYASNKSRPLIQQGLANGDPDVDAIFRLTRASSGQLIRVEFDSEAIPIAVPPGSMCPFNTQNTLYHKDAFWGLLVPITTTFRVCDIWRGYWVQRLLSDIGGVLAFYPPSVKQDRNVHNYFDDFLDEDDLYRKSRPFVDFLLRWESKEAHLFNRGLSLMGAMVRESFVKEKDMALLAAWFWDLLSVGYVPPAPVQNVRIAPNDLEKLPAGKITPKSLKSTYLQTWSHYDSLERFHAIHTFLRNIVLVLNFKNNGYIAQSLDFWLAFYERLFETIVVVSTKPNKQLGVISYNGTESPGSMSHYVLRKVLAEHPTAEGYLWLDSNVIINYWNFLLSDKSKVWFPPRRDWQTVEQSGDLPWTELAPEFQSQLQESLGGKTAVFASASSNVFYLPKRLSANFSAVLSTFERARVKAEVCIPSALSAVENPSNFDPNALQSMRKLPGSSPTVLAQEFSSSLSGVYPWTVETDEQKENLLNVLSTGDSTL